jgi:hypothetical protein
MKTAISMTACLLLALSSNAAQAGACTAGIETLTKTMSSKDAGSGPTMGAGGTGNAQPQASGQLQHPPAAIMGQETQGKATSPDDVRRQTEGRPTAASGSPESKPGEASVALSRAKDLDALGREAECIEAVRNAQRLVGASGGKQ